MGFPTKNYLFWVFWGYRHLRKHSYISGKILTTSSDLNQKGALVLEVNPSGQERHINCRKCRRRNLETDLYRYRDTVTYYHIEYINMDLWSFVPCFRSLIVYETVMGRITLHVYFFFQCLLSCIIHCFPLVTVLLFKSWFNLSWWAWSLRIVHYLIMMHLTIHDIESIYVCLYIFMRYTCRIWQMNILDLA